MLIGYRLQCYDGMGKTGILHDPMESQTHQDLEIAQGGNIVLAHSQGDLNEATYCNAIAQCRIDRYRSYLWTGKEWKETLSARDESNPFGSI